MVVLAILFILASLMAPALKRAKDSARQMQCMSNLRQLGTALNMYADEWDDSFPTIHCGGGSYPDQYESVWYANASFMKNLNMSPYPPKQRTIAVCPSHAAPWPGWSNNWISYSGNAYFGFSYIPRPKRSAFSTPAQTMAFCDGSLTYYMNIDITQYIDYRHNNGALVVYLDGHVDRREPGSIPEGWANRYDPFWALQ